MISPKKRYSLPEQFPLYYIYVVAYNHPILEFAHQLDVHLNVQFELIADYLDEEFTSNIQVFVAEGDYCKEKIMLIENKVDNSYILPAFKRYRHILLVTHHGILDRGTYTSLIQAMKESPETHNLTEKEISKIKKTRLELLLRNLD